MRTGNSVVFARVVDETHARGLGVYAACGVAHDGVVAPGRFPEFVRDLDVFFGDGVAVVVLGLLGASEVARCRVEIAGYNLEISISS